MNAYDQARSNAGYWIQWARNPHNVALQTCAAIPSCALPHLRDKPLCLDCHGPLRELMAFVFRCDTCQVIHGMSGGHSSPYARFHRSGLLTIRRANIERDFSATCLLSDYPPFQRWLSRRRRDS
jgi:hypothetical protein